MVYQRGLLLGHVHIEFLMNGNDFLHKDEFELFDLILVSLIDVFEFFYLNMKPIDTLEFFNFIPELWILLKYSFMFVNKILILLLKIGILHL